MATFLMPFQGCVPPKKRKNKMKSGIQGFCAQKRRIGDELQVLPKLGPGDAVSKSWRPGFQILAPQFPKRASQFPNPGGEPVSKSWRPSFQILGGPVSKAWSLSFQSVPPSFQILEASSFQIQGSQFPNPGFPVSKSWIPSFQILTASFQILGRRFQILAANFQSAPH